MNVLILLIFGCYVHSQNLPSLLMDKNINATFSIIGYDETAKEWGIAVATDNIYVGNSTIYIEPNVGAFSVIAETEPSYGISGLAKLKKGKSIEQVLTEISCNDAERNYRQVSGMDNNGHVSGFTGKSLKFWQGHASMISGENYIVAGNQLAENVLEAMSESFEKSEGTLGQKLLKSLIAGQNEGGQRTGKQSAAIVVKGLHNEWFNQIDLRVDNSKEPIKELQTLMNYHYGRIRLNQSIFAFREGNRKLAKDKLIASELMLNGWTGIYSKIAFIHIALNNEDGAVKWIKKGLEENPNWSVNLPAFYVLHEHPEIKTIIKPETFGEKEWKIALGMLSNLGREMELITLGNTLLEKNIQSSYLYFLVGRAYYYENDLPKAILFLTQALDIDVENVEAEKLLSDLKNY